MVRKIDSDADGCDHVCFHNNGELWRAVESVTGKLFSKNRNLTQQQIETITS